MSTNNGHDVPSPAAGPDDEPDWASHTRHAQQLEDPIAQGVALEAIERDRLTFADRKRFIDRYEHDARATRDALKTLATGQRSIGERLDRVAGLLEGVAAAVGVNEGDVEALVDAERARRARDAAADTAAAQTRARVDTLAADLARVSHSELEPLAEAVDEIMDTQQRRLLAEAAAGHVLLQDAAQTALRVRIQSSADIAREERVEQREEKAFARTERSKLVWWVLGIVAAVISVAAAGAAGRLTGHPVEPPAGEHEHHHKE